MVDWVSMTIGLLIGAVFVLYFTIRKPMAFAAVSERNRTSFEVSGEPRDILDAVIAFARHSRYKLGAVDEASQTVVLEDGISLFNYGALFQVAISAAAPGQSTIQVATVGRGFQWGPAFQRSKRAFLEALQGAIDASRKQG
ncbi:MAG: hypothetical protein ABW198_07565 [Pseudorhodoplanes sp.]